MGAGRVPPPPPPPQPLPSLLQLLLPAPLARLLPPLALLLLSLALPAPPQPWGGAQLHASAAPRACVPLDPANNNGTWSRSEGSEEELPRWRFTRAHPCAFSIASAADLYARFDGRTLAFVGDSQVREFVRSLAGHAQGCCWMQPARACDHAAVVNATACSIIQLAEHYPKGVQEFLLRDTQGRAVRLLYSWAAYPLELLQPEYSPYFLPYLRGEARPDALLMSWGHWDLIFTQPKRSDNQGGLSALLEHGGAVGRRVAAAAAEHPHILRTLLWRQMYPDEVDAWPHPQHRKRMVLPSFREATRAALRGVWGSGAGGVGLRVWDVYERLDVRAGGVTRPYNENALTMDGMHLLPEVDVELAWELLSYWSEEVVARGAA